MQCAKIYWFRRVVNGFWLVERGSRSDFFSVFPAFLWTPSGSAIAKGNAVAKYWPPVAPTHNLWFQYRNQKKTFTFHSNINSTFFIWTEQQIQTMWNVILQNRELISINVYVICIKKSCEVVRFIMEARHRFQSYLLH